MHLFMKHIEYLVEHVAINNVYKQEYFYLFKATVEDMEDRCCTIVGVLSADERMSPYDLGGLLPDGTEFSSVDATGTSNLPETLDGSVIVTISPSKSELSRPKIVYYSKEKELMVCDNFCAYMDYNLFKSVIKGEGEVLSVTSVVTI